MTGVEQTVPRGVGGSTSKRIRLLLVLLIVVIPCVSVVCRQTQRAEARLQWTSSKVYGRPEGATPFRLERISGLSFNEPLDHVNLPGRTDSLVLERNGRLLRVSRESGAWQAHTVCELGNPAFSVLPAQDFDVSGELFVTITERFDSKRAASAEEFVVRVRRLRFDPVSFSAIDTIGQVIAEWPVQSVDGHVGGALAFDRSGCLIIGTGDGGDSRGVGPAYELGQNMNDLRAKLLRVDPRTRTTSPSPAPSDNPFIDSPEILPEIFSSGMRNPWKFATHPSTQDVYVFNVGEDLWETVYRAEAGSNAGWPLFEGSQPFRHSADDLQHAPSLLKPVIEMSHAECRAIVGGHFYFGKQFEQLNGELIFGDYASGAVFAATIGQTPRVLAQSGQPLLEISADQDGELLVFSQSGDVFRLVPQSPGNSHFPRHLSETGLFTDTAQYITSTGVIDYEVNSPLYSDGAAKRRHIALPKDSRITFSENHPWKFPDGTVFVKTFQVDDTLLSHRLETRLIHFEGGQYNAYSYRWNDDQTDAALVNDAGDAFTYRTSAGTQATWQIPGRTQCMMCHTVGASFVLGFNTPQTNRMVETSTGRVNQLEYFESAGLFAEKLPRKYHVRGLLTSSAVDSFPRLAAPADKSHSLSDRAFSYLYANCAHCHRYLGGGNSQFSLDLQLGPTANYGLIGVGPIHGSLNMKDSFLVAPGAPDRSILLERMRHRDKSHMPKIGTSRNDEDGIDLIQDWIRSLAATEGT